MSHLVIHNNVELHRRYEATVQIRRGDGWTVRPEAESLDGQRGTFTAAWVFDDDERYAGEVAMIFGREWGPVSFAWTASGDLHDIRPIDQKAETGQT